MNRTVENIKISFNHHVFSIEWRRVGGWEVAATEKSKYNFQLCNLITLLGIMFAICF